MNRERSTLSPERRHLTKESIMRIQITLSSRKSSVVVFNTYARLVAVGNGQWNSIAVGAPCIVLLKETAAPDSPFQVRLAIAEVESGISIWEEELDYSTANYSELQPTFHTFTANGQSLALQFADAIEASSLSDCLKQYIAQKTTTDLVLQGKNGKGKNKKSKKNQTQETASKRVSKFDISSPCEFRHLSGITAGGTNECQQELEDSVIRRQRSASMSAISTKKVKQRGKIPKEMADDSLYLKSDKENIVKKRPPIATPDMQNAQQIPNPISNRRGLFKSSSVRVTKRKPIIDQIKTSDDSSLNSTPSHSTLNSSQEHSYWTIDDLRNTRTKKSPDHENEPSTITFKNSAPSQIQQAWRNSINTEDSSSKSSRSSTPFHGIANSSASLQSDNLLERRQTWTDGLLPLNSSPAHLRLNTSPDHQPNQTVSSPPHVVAAANAKKYLNVQPNFNTYDTLLPLEAAAGKKLPPLTPLSNNVQKENPLLKHLLAAKTITTTAKPPPLTIKENSVVTPPTVDSPTSHGDLEVLSAELSRVLKDFDSLIAPSSPLEPTFQYKPTFAKETMV